MRFILTNLSFQTIERLEKIYKDHSFIFKASCKFISAPFKELIFQTLLNWWSLHLISGIRWWNFTLSYANIHSKSSLRPHFRALTSSQFDLEVMCSTVNQRIDWKTHTNVIKQSIPCWSSVSGSVYILDQTWMQDVSWWNWSELTYSGTPIKYFLPIYVCADRHEAKFSKFSFQFDNSCLDFTAKGLPTILLHPSQTFMNLGSICLVSLYVLRMKSPRFSFLT